MREYRIMEKADEEDRWYNHGIETVSSIEAIDELRQKQNRYGKYGRVFRIEAREVSDWEPYEA